MIVKVEQALLKDIGYVANLEIKCQEYPIVLDTLKEYFLAPEHKGLVARISNRVVGYAIFQTVQTPDVKRDITVITRIGTHPDFRMLGVSKSLMFEIEKQAWKQSHNCLRIYIPSYKCDDIHDPDYLVDWLYKFHFKVSKCAANTYNRYGKMWDAYVFEREL